LWLLSPVALIPQPDIKKCPHCKSVHIVYLK
jgi:hypothetical protein